MPLLGEGAGTAGAEIGRKLGRSAPSFTLPACSQHISTNLQIKTQRVRGVMYRVVFLTAPPQKMPLDWPPPKFAWTGPPLISLSVGITLPDT